VSPSAAKPAVHIAGDTEWPTGWPSSAKRRRSAIASPLLTMGGLRWGSPAAVAARPLPQLPPPHTPLALRAILVVSLDPCPEAPRGHAHLREAAGAERGRVEEGAPRGPGGDRVAAPQARERRERVEAAGRAREPPAMGGELGAHGRPEPHLERAELGARAR